MSPKKQAKSASRKPQSDSSIAEQIDDASLTLLEDPGVRLEHDAILKLLLSKRAKPGASADVVRLPRKMVREFVSLAPKEVVFTNRRGGRHVMNATSAPTYWSAPALMLSSVP